MALLKYFEPVGQADIRTMVLQSLKMQDVLKAIALYDLPTIDYRIKDIRRYAESLVQAQISDVLDDKHGRWLLVDQKDQSRWERRCAAEIMPSFIATATLSLVLRRFPGVAVQIPGYSEALKAGLNYCGRRLEISALRFSAPKIFDVAGILLLGEVAYLVAENPELSTQMHRKAQPFVITATQRLFSKGPHPVWQEDRQGFFDKAIVELINPNDEW